MLQKSGEQHGSEVLLELHRFTQKKYVLVVREVKLPAGLLVLVAHFVQLSAASSGWKTSCFEGKSETPIGKAEVKLILISFILTIISFGWR